MDIQGNEAADAEAKKAAGNPNADVNTRFGILVRRLPVSRSAHLQKLREAAKVRYSSNFREGPRFHRVASFDPSMPSNKFIRSTAGLPR